MDTVAEKEADKAPWMNFELEFYKECGHMYRHFSTIRVAIMTAGVGSVLTMAAYILINTGSREALILWALSIIVLYSFVITIASVFTVKANQAKDYMMQMEARAYKMSAEICSGPFTKVAFPFYPTGKIFDAITGSFIFASFILVGAFIYRIMSI